MASVVRTGCLLGLVLALLLPGCPSSDPFPSNPDGNPSGDGSADANHTDTSDPPPIVLDCKTSPSGGKPMPSAEPGVRIVEPTGLPGALVSNNSVMLGGRAWGDIDRLVVERADGQGEPIVVSPVPFYWQAGPVVLDTGDTTIRVRAESDARPGETLASDSVVLTRYLSPLTGISVQSSPDHVVVGELRTVRLTLTVPFGQVDDSQVNLYTVNAQGDNVSPVDVVKMKDDGVDCDQTAGDRVFSVCKDLIQLTPTPIYVRARLNVPGTGVIATPMLAIGSVKRLQPSECLAMRTALQTAEKAYGTSSDHEAGLHAATQTLSVPATEAPSVLKNPQVGQAVDGHGLWVRFSNGVLGALPLGLPPGSRGGIATVQSALSTHHIGSRMARLLRTGKTATEVDYARSVLDDSQCPPFDTQGTATGAQAHMGAFRDLHGHGVIALSGHGGAYFGDVADQYSWRHQGAQEVLWIGDSNPCSGLMAETQSCETDSDCPDATTCNLLQGTGECVNQSLPDLMLGRAVIGPSMSGIAPSFVAHYAQDRLPNALVYVGACYSHWNGSLAMAFLGAGAGAYLGYSSVISDAFANAAGKHLFDGLVTERKTLQKAQCLAQEGDGAWLRMAGNSALSLDIPEILNAGLETEALQGWNTTGDARRVPSFCGTQPSEGKFMAVLSTGLGFAKEAGTLTQEFCIPTGAQTLEFSWRYISAELEGTCGLSGVQDTWSVRLESTNSSQKMDIIDCTVNDMCEYEAAHCLPKPCNPGSDCTCGACYKPYAPEPNCLFQDQPVMATEFLQESINVSAFAGSGPVTLTFSVDDKAKQVYETAVLIDAIRIQ